MNRKKTKGAEKHLCPNCNNPMSPCSMNLACEKCHTTLNYVSLPQQPTTESAEEILERHWVRETGKPISDMTKSHREYVITMMNEHTSLHAQRIADMMVKDKLVDEYQRGFADGISEERNNDRC